MERDQSKQTEAALSLNGVGHFRIPDPNNPSQMLHYRYLSLNPFSQIAIEDLLSRIAQGLNPNRDIAFVPNDAQANNYTFKTSGELVQLGNQPESKLKILAAQIKTSQIALTLQRTS